jgi:MATE family multidrug resistance protein
MARAMQANSRQSAQALTWRAHAGATLSLGLPLIGAQLAQVAIGTTDAVMVGWLGARELAAVTLGGAAFFVVLMFGAGFAFALIPMVAQASAKGDHDAMRKAVRSALAVVLVYATAMMPLLWFIEPILLAVGQEAEIAAMTAGYVNIMQWSLYPALIVMVLRSFFSGIQWPRVVLLATLAAAGLNVAFNYALIFGNWGFPRLELQGAAIASVLSVLVSLAVLVVRLEWTVSLRQLSLFSALHQPDNGALREILRHGFQISLTIIAEIGLFTAASTMMGWLGAAQLAAHGIALQLASLVFMIPLGLSNAAAVRVGESHALGRYADVRRAALTVIAMSVAVSTLSAVAFLAIPNFLVSLFLDPRNDDAAQVLAHGVVLLAMAASFQLVDGMQALAAGLLRGLKDTARPALIAVFSYWGVGFPAAYFLGFPAGFGGPGVWAGLAFGLAVAAALLTLRFFRLTANPQRALASESPL